MTIRPTTQHPAIHTTDPEQRINARSAITVLNTPKERSYPSLVDIQPPQRITQEMRLLNHRPLSLILDLLRPRN